MTTNSTPKPAAHRGTPIDPDGVGIDLVAGDPPVPITVWRTARSDEDSATITARLAARLIIAYSRPGETVVDLTADHTLTGACARGRRAHHPGWFTDTSLIVGPATVPTDADDTPTPHDDLTDDFDEADPDDGVPGLDDWFGDDLTDPDLPPHPTTPAAVVDPSAPLTGNTSLVVAAWPLDTGGQAPNRVRLAFLLATCARLLRPGGCLVLVVATPPGVAAVPQDLSDVVDAAAHTGLGYLQHIVALTTADTDGDRFTYHAAPTDLATLAGGDPSPAVHLRVHADLMIFTQAGDLRG